MIGRIDLRPTEAILTHDTGGMMTSMSPYMKIKLNNYAHCTQKSSGKEPRWQEKPMQFTLSGESGFQVEIWDSDMLSADDMVG